MAAPTLDPIENIQLDPEGSVGVRPGLNTLVQTAAISDLVVEVPVGEPAPGNIPDTFVRIEDKYLMPRRYELALVKVLDWQLQRSKFEKGKPYAKIESVYLDSPEYVCFSDHLRRLDTRYKMRLRRYAHELDWREDDAMFVEIKEKQSGVTEKTRVGLTSRDRKRLIFGMPIELTHDLREVNRKMGKKKLAKRVALINHIRESYALSPVLSTIYHRKSYEKGGLRVTLDSDLRYRGLKGISRGLAREFMGQWFWTEAEGIRRKYQGDDLVIVEVKHRGTLPSWLVDFFGQIQMPKTSFSKYCWSMTGAMSRST